MRFLPVVPICRRGARLPRTCQNVSAGSHMPAATKLLCMGLFSIFWVREPRRPCGWPAGPELAAAPAIPTLPLPPGSLRPPREEEEQERSASLPLFWRCGVVSFSSKTIAVVLTATNRQRFGPRLMGVTQGSGNVDSQHQVRSSGRGGQHGSYPRDSGCIAAHPADWRASAS